jgi:hypothetical protein
MHRIELLKTHTHANEVHFAGHVIDVDEHTARWLIEKGVGKAVDDSPAVKETAAGTASIPETQSQRKAKE